MNKKLITAYIFSAFNVLLIAVSVGFSLYTFIFVPIFIIALFFTIKGNLRGWFVWVGCICFLVDFSARNISNESYIPSFLRRSSLISLSFLNFHYFPRHNSHVFDIKTITLPLINRVPGKLPDRFSYYWSSIPCGRESLIYMDSNLMKE